MVILLLKKKKLLEENKKGCDEKMEFERVVPTSDFLKLEAGQEVTGVYVGKEQSVKFPEHENFILEIKGVGQKKVSGAMLENLFAEVKVGTVVKLVFKGKTKNKKGIEFNEYELYAEKKQDMIGLDGTKHPVKEPAPLFTGKI
jgi:hypothetical protein